MKSSATAKAILLSCALSISYAMAGDSAPTRGAWEPFNPTQDELKAAKAVPHFKDGQFAGYTLMVVRKGSRFEKLGLKAGDVLQTIDGQPLTENKNDMGTDAKGK